MSDVTPTALDPRLLRITFQVGNQLHSFDASFAIHVKGQKFANAQQNECTATIYNLDTNTRNYILTETSPFNLNQTPKTLSVYAGRVSTGEFLIYSGTIANSQIKQPPDIALILKCGTKHEGKGKAGSRSGGANTKLSVLGGGIASNLGLTLHNEANERTVANYTHNGNALDEVNNLTELGVDAYVDDNQLVIKESGIALTGSTVVLSETSGMIGVPEVTEKGLKVKFLYTPVAKLGGAIQIISVLNPAANGFYVIFKLNFDLASRDTPFYLMAECKQFLTSGSNKATAVSAGGGGP